MNALEWLDSAFALARRGGLRFGLRAWAAGAPLAFACVVCFYVERVEGVRDARALLALGLALGWWVRAHTLGRILRHELVRLDEPVGDPPSSLEGVGLSSAAGAVMVVALAPAAALARFGAVAVVPALFVALPIAAIAPTWLARMGVSRLPGAGLWAGGVSDGRSLRGASLVVHGCLALGTALLFLNLLALSAMLLGAFRSFLGVEVAALMSFLSLENDFALLVIGALSLLVSEPLRAALAAVALMHARSRRDGADLRRMVHALADEAPPGAGTAARTGLGAIAALIVAWVASAGQAQPPEPTLAEVAPEAPPTSAPTPADAFDHVAPEVAFGGDASPAEGPAELYLPEALPALPDADRAIADEVTVILARPEFREFEDARADGAGGGEGETLLERLLEALMRWLEELRPDDGANRAVPSPMPVPPPWFFATIAGALLVAVVAYLALSWRRERVRRAASDGEQAPALDPRDRAPEEHLDEAAALAAQGRYREAFRSLYLATLVSLDRRGEIDFDPARTNWHYLRQMGGSARARPFRTFTQLFDQKWYGDEPTTADEYERGRQLARSLAASSEGDPG